MARMELQDVGTKEGDPTAGDDTATAKRSKMKLVTGKNGKKKQVSTAIVIKRQERAKRKHVTVVTNLQHNDVDLKKAAKLFAGKFACGASVVKNAQGEEEVVVQGDVADGIVSVIAKTWKSVNVELISVVDETKKKATPAAAEDDDEEQD